MLKILCFFRIFENLLICLKWWSPRKLIIELLMTGTFKLYITTKSRANRAFYEQSEMAKTAIVLQLFPFQMCGTLEKVFFFLAMNLSLSLYAEKSNQRLNKQKG